MHIPAHICKRISKKWEHPICRGSCTHCPCVGIVRWVYNVLGGNPKQDLSLTELPEKVQASLQTNGDRVWRIFLAGWEMTEESWLDDGCGHRQMFFNRTLPDGFMNADDTLL